MSKDRAKVRKSILTKLRENDPANNRVDAFLRIFVSYFKMKIRGGLITAFSSI